MSVSNATTTNATLSVTATGRSGPTITSNPTGICSYVGLPSSGTFVAGSSGGEKRASCTFILKGDASVTGNIQ